MKKLHELLRKEVRKGDFGIEIECEGANLPILDGMNPFIQLDDGSLRGLFPESRSEYVLRSPDSIENVMKSVEGLIALGKANKTKFDFSFRTSIHVHMNVQQLTANQYLNLVYTYYIIEEALMRYCGDERIGNRFCLRLQDADEINRTIHRLLRDFEHEILRLNMDEIKYAALNMAATTRYGSIEFRGMQGNLNPDYIRIWLRALLSLREFACKFDDVTKVHDFFVSTKPTEFLKDVLQDVYNFFSYENEEHDMRTNFSLTIDIPYVFKQNVEARAKLKEREENERVKLEIKVPRAPRRRNAIMGNNAHAIMVDDLEFDEYEMIQFNPIEDNREAMHIGGIVLQDMRIIARERMARPANWINNPAAEVFPLPVGEPQW